MSTDDGKRRGNSEQSVAKIDIKSNDLMVDKPSKEGHGKQNQYAASEELQLELTRFHLGRETRDERLKKGIRILKFVSRTLGAILSLATVVTLAMTIQKYLSTRNTYYNVNGIQRTASPTDAEMVYNNVYLAFSTISFVVNIVILLAYFRGIQKANELARIGAIWSGILLGAHIIAMVTGVAVYGAGADDKDSNGVNRDLWGWSCSSAAQGIQPWIDDVQF